jgi:protein ImuB
MFACLYSLSTPVAALVRLAEDFTPRFDVVGPVVMLDVSGLSRLFGTPREIGEQVRRSAPGPVRIALAPTQTAAALLAMGRPGLSVVLDGEQSAALAALPVSLLGEFDRLRLTHELTPVDRHPAPEPAPAPPSVSPFEDTLPYFQQSVMDRASSAAIHTHCGGGGWKHPRDSHAANHVRRPRREVTTPRELEHPAPATRHPASASARSEVHASYGVTSPKPPLRGGEGGPRTSRLAPAAKAALTDIQSVLGTLRRWGVNTFAAFTALPAGEVYERLGARGVLWQRLARGEDTTPLVPWIPEDPFEGALDLEWPIEGLEPLSFVLGRLFEPLSERLERADRGAAIVHTHLRLVNKETHARMLQLPAPMRDAKTLRTLVLLDLETHPPAAGVDRVRVLVEPTPARVVQWALFDRAQASPEEVSTLVARLTALMGEGHVGSPQLVDTWKPGAFTIQPFATQADAAPPTPPSALRTPHSAPRTAHAAALRRFRLPVPARVVMKDGRPVRVMTDRRGVSGGPVVDAAGPWRTSGEWWNSPSLALNDERASTEQGAPALRTSHDAPRTRASAASAWDRDEWDVALHDGTIYRVYVERDAGQWFIDGVVD